MDYLVREGYPAAAQKFAAEANMPMVPEYEPIQARVSIRNDIYAGKIETAIEKINEVAPQVNASSHAICQQICRQTPSEICHD